MTTKDPARRFPNDLRFTAMEVVDTGDQPPQTMFVIDDLHQCVRTSHDNRVLSKVVITFPTYAEVEAFCERQMVNPVLDDHALELKNDLETA